MLSPHVESYYDVESYDDEVTSDISLTELGIIARFLSVEPAAILEPNRRPDRPRRSLEELMAAIPTHRAVSMSK